MKWRYTTADENVWLPREQYRAVASDFGYDLVVVAEHARYHSRYCSLGNPACNLVHPVKNKSEFFMLLRCITFILFTSLCFAQAVPPGNKPIPPAGIEIPAADRAELQAGVAALSQEIATLRVELKGKPKLLELFPDVQIFYNAVYYALKYNEILNAREIPVAKAQLKQGLERAQELRAGKPSWTTQTGLVVRGYVSKIDGSVQPYGLVVPATYQTKLPFQYRLDVWFHGRS